MANKILLLQSYLGRREFVTFPIALATLAAHIGEGYELRGFDPNVCEAPEDDLRTELEYYKPDIVAISLRNIDTTNLFDPHIYYNGFLTTIKIVREACRDACLIVGGSGFSLFSEQIMKDNPQINVGVYLEGEDAFPELLENIHNPGKVKGLYYRENNRVYFTGRRELAPIDNPPFPIWDIFEIERYKKYPVAFGVETKRGCIFKCAYCSYFILHGRKIRTKTPERVLEEIAELRRRFGIKEVCFLDSVFNVPVDHALTILRMMKKEFPEMSWLGYLSERELKEDFAEAAMETGLKVFVFSSDAYTDSCLQLMGKRVTVEKINHAVEVIRNTPPVHIGFDFFVNGPGYSYATLAAMFWFLVRTKLKLRKRFRLMRLNLGYIRIEPGTPIHKEALQNGDLTDQVNLLPLNRDGFRRCFYFNKNLWLFNLFFIFFNKAIRRIITPAPLVVDNDGFK